MTQPDAERIRRALQGAAASQVERIAAFDKIDSTNTWLKREPSPAPGRATVAIADHQTAGRGRDDHEWLSSPGSSLCLSLAYTFRTPPELLPPLTLALGVAIAGGLRQIGIGDVQLKWPNDLLIDGAKLGGILVESQLGKRDAVTVVAGTGINIDVPDAIASKVRSGWAHGPVGLTSVNANLPERDELAAILVQAIVEAMTLYDERGLAPFEQAFVELDWLLGRSIVVTSPQGEVAGIAAGIERDGALLLQRVNGVERIHSGSILIEEHRAAGQRAV